MHICGIPKSCDQGTFTWPDTIECGRFSDFLDDRDQVLAHTGTPSNASTIAVQNVRNYVVPMLRDGMNPTERDFVIACDSSQDRAKCWLERSPCITKSGSRGQWITSRGRRMKTEEMVRLQGTLPNQITRAVSWNELGEPNWELHVTKCHRANILEPIACSRLRA